MMNPRDVLVIPLSDMHSGGTTALFLGRQWQGLHQNHMPTDIQWRIREHWDKCIAELSEMRAGKKVIVVVNGDAVDGVHHDSNQVVTRVKGEQAEIHKELVNEFLQGIDFREDDDLYYVSGTETHTDDNEHGIAKDLGAVGEKAHDELVLTVNGKQLLFSHHGPNAGKGANEGNALRNWARDIYFNDLRDGIKTPDVIVTGHVHTPAYTTFTIDWNTIHAVICPSWQLKTRYAYKAAPVQRTKIGIQPILVTADGLISVPRPQLMATGR